VRACIYVTEIVALFFQYNFEVCDTGNVGGMNDYRGQYAIVTLGLRPADFVDQQMLVVDTEATVVNRSGEPCHTSEVKYSIDGVRKGIDDVVAHYLGSVSSSLVSRSRLSNL
jgi:hypothetical protein